MINKPKMILPQRGDIITLKDYLGENEEPAWVLEEPAYNEAGQYQVGVQLDTKYEKGVKLYWAICEPLLGIWHLGSKYTGKSEALPKTDLILPEELIKAPVKRKATYLDKETSKSRYWKYQNTHDKNSDILYIDLGKNFNTRELYKKITRVFEKLSIRDGSEGFKVVQGIKPCSTQTAMTLYFKKHQIGNTCNPITEKEYLEAYNKYNVNIM